MNWIDAAPEDIAARYGFSPPLGDEDLEIVYGRPSTLAGVLDDFSQLSGADPKFASAWGEISAQLNIEGADPTQIEGAKIALTSSFEQLTSQSLGVSASDALSAAKQFVMAGQTIAGAASTVQGLVELATTPNVNIPQLTQIFTGTMIGTLSLVSGAVSAGAGAAIVGAVGALVGILQSAGLFGSSPPGVDICQGMKCNPVPDWLIGCENRQCPCLCVWNTSGSSGVIAPGSRDWRSFPNRSDPADADWFKDALLGGDFSFVWKGLRFGRTLTVNPAGDSRPVDEAFGPAFFVDFPAYASVEQFTSPAAIAVSKQIEVLSPRPLGFSVQPGGPLSLAYCAAWKANAEYSLNGLKAQPAWVVLLHTIRLWNRSHSGPVFAWNASSGPSQWGPVLSDLSKNVPTSDPIWLADGSVAINEGAILNPAAAPPAPVGVLSQGQSLVQGQTLSSPDGRFGLTMQTDGNLALYDASGNFLWGSHQNLGVPLAVQGVIMQRDGDLTLWDTSGRLLWSAHSALGVPLTGAQLAMQTDGNLVLYDASGVALWTSGTQGGQPAPAPVSTPAPSTSSGAKAAAVTVVTAAATGGLWFLLGQPLSLAALKTAVEEAVHSAAGAFRS